MAGYLGVSDLGLSENGGGPSGDPGIAGGFVVEPSFDSLRGVLNYTQSLRAPSCLALQLTVRWPKKKHERDVFVAGGSQLPKANQPLDVLVSGIGPHVVVWK